MDKYQSKYLVENYSERMCELCEQCIYGETMNTNQYNLCEGSRCDEAEELMQEEIDEEREINVNIIKQGFETIYNKD